MILRCGGKGDVFAEELLEALEMLDQAWESSLEEKPSGNGAWQGESSLFLGILQFLGDFLGISLFSLSFPSPFLLPFPSDGLPVFHPKGGAGRGNLVREAPGFIPARFPCREMKLGGKMRIKDGFGSPGSPISINPSCRYRPLIRACSDPGACRSAEQGLGLGSEGIR